MPFFFEFMCIVVILKYEVHLIYSLERKKAGLRVKVFFWVVILVMTGVMIACGLILTLDLEPKHILNDCLIVSATFSMIFVTLFVYYHLSKRLYFGSLKELRSKFRFVTIIITLVLFCRALLTVWHPLSRYNSSEV